jgi:hypothetical protein
MAFKQREKKRRKKAAMISAQGKARATARRRADGG